MQCITVSNKALQMTKERQLRYLLHGILQICKMSYKRYLKITKLPFLANDMFYSIFLCLYVRLCSRNWYLPHFQSAGRATTASQSTSWRAGPTRGPPRARARRPCTRPPPGDTSLWSNCSSGWLIVTQQPGASTCSEGFVMFWGDILDHERWILRCLWWFCTAALALKVGWQGRQIQACSYSIFHKLKILLPFGDGTQ